MNVPEVCFNCVITKMTKFADRKIPQEIRDDFIFEATKKISYYAEYENPIELEAAWERIARIYLHTEDPHEEEKNFFQQGILQIESQIEASLQDTHGLEDSIKFALAGNIIDFSTMHHITMETVRNTMDKAKNAQLDQKLLSQLEEELGKAKNLVYLLDNVGEVVFDKIFIKKLQHKYPGLKITAIASGSPISSDVTHLEAKGIGLDQYCTVLSNGNDITGTYLPKCNPETVAAMEKADLIISKGMANFESLIGSGYNIYYIFLCKCAYYSNLLDVPLLSEMFMNERKVDGKKLLSKENCQR
ncbi:MAG: damage-control phosphatase ARMT1 family protein [Eubacteriales bacterium]